MGKTSTSLEFVGIQKFTSSPQFQKKHIFIKTVLPTSDHANMEAKSEFQASNSSKQGSRNVQNYQNQVFKVAKISKMQKEYQTLQTGFMFDRISIIGHGPYSQHLVKFWRPTQLEISPRIKEHISKVFCKILEQMKTIWTQIQARKQGNSPSLIDRTWDLKSTLGQLS